MATSVHTLEAAPFELRYESLFHHGRAFAFPCDEHGRVDLDVLSDGLRQSYFYVRAMVGREFATPSVSYSDAALLN